MTEERRIQLVAEVDATGTRAGFNEISREAGTMAASVERASQQAGAAVTGVGSGAGSASRNVEAAQRNLIGSIQRTTAAMEAGSRTGAAYYEILARQRGVDPAILEPYLAQLRAVEATQTHANAALGGAAAPLRQVGVSAAQTAAALRGVPAQFTDIVTSLQGGQAPLTVLFQQGGQLRDMFGSAGGAARALGGFVMGLVTPLTTAAAAAVAVGLAFHQGNEEARAYRAALIESGNAAGTTSDQLSDMARSISESVGTQGAAAEALAALVGTGKVAASNLVQFSTVAVKAQRDMGQSVEDTAKQFADLAAAPVTALLKVNEKLHFLTGSTYEQVRALQEQGRMYEAAQLAQKSYASAFDGVTQKVESNLGVMQKGWIGVKDFAKSAWDAMLNVGREDTLEQKLAKVQEALAKARDPHAFGSLDAQGHLQENIELEQSLKNQIASRDHVAKIQGEQAKFNAADLAWSESKFEYLTRSQQLQAELQKAQEMGLAAGVSDEDIQKRLLAIRLKYNDIYNDGVDAQIEALKRREAVEDVVTQRTLARIAAARSAGSITDKDSVNQSADAELVKIDRHRAALIAELALSKTKQNSLKEQKELSGQIDVVDKQRTNRELQRGYDLLAIDMKRLDVSQQLYISGIASAASDAQALRDQVKAQRESNEEIGRSASEIIKIRDQRANNIADLKDESAAALEALEPGSELAKQYREQAAALRERSAAERDGFVKLRDPWVSLSASLRRYTEDASNAGAQIGEAMSNAFRSAEDAFVSFVTTGKLSFSSLANSILADLARIEARKAIAGLVSLATDAFAANFGPSTIGDLSGTRANGGPVSSGLSYLVGERGPEIFTPQSSGTIIPNHEIGGGGITVNTNVNVQSGGATSQTTGDASGTGRALAEMINSKVKEVLVRETRQGGILWNSQMGRA
jgi:lambda family phage tail tape measure protein